MGLVEPSAGVRVPTPSVVRVLLPFLTPDNGIYARFHGRDRLIVPLLAIRLGIDTVAFKGYQEIPYVDKEVAHMHKNIVAMTVLASLAVAALAFNAVAGTPERGTTLEQRVTILEESADRQRRAIEGLREENVGQQKLIAKLLRFRTDANEQLAALENRPARLSGQGVYSGPVDNGQLQLGSEPAACGGEIAEWNAAGTSLGCVPPAP